MLLCPNIILTCQVSFVLCCSVVAFQCLKVWKCIFSKLGFASCCAFLLRCKKKLDLKPLLPANSLSSVFPCGRLQSISKVLGDSGRVLPLLCFSPFAEKAGMKRVAEQLSVKSVAKLSQLLVSLGFDLQFLGSKSYVKSNLEHLTSEELVRLREGFLHNKHPRFRAQFASLGRRQPFFSKAQWTSAIETADLKKIGDLIRVIGVLLQTKVYLFWEKTIK